MIKEVKTLLDKKEFGFELKVLKDEVKRKDLQKNKILKELQKESSSLEKEIDMKVAKLADLEEFTKVEERLHQREEHRRARPGREIEHERRDGGNRAGGSR